MQDIEVHWTSLCKLNYHSAWDEIRHVLCDTDSRSVPLPDAESQTLAWYLWNHTHWLFLLLVYFIVPLKFLQGESRAVSTKWCWIYSVWQCSPTNTVCSFQFLGTNGTNWAFWLIFRFILFFLSDQITYLSLFSLFLKKKSAPLLCHDVTRPMQFSSVSESPAVL